MFKKSKMFFSFVINLQTRTAEKSLTRFSGPVLTLFPFLWCFVILFLWAASSLLQTLPSFHERYVCLWTSLWKLSPEVENARVFTDLNTFDCNVFMDVNSGENEGPAPLIQMLLIVLVLQSAFVFTSANHFILTKSEKLFLNSVWKENVLTSRFQWNKWVDSRVFVVVVFVHWDSSGPFCLIRSEDICEQKQLKAPGFPFLLRWSASLSFRLTCRIRVSRLWCLRLFRAAVCCS